MTKHVHALAAAALVLPLFGAADRVVPESGIGTVHMPISCSASAGADFDRGLALLHNFWYDRAQTVFDAIIAREPQCRMAYWGAAMTLNHPLWSSPTKTDVTAALAYVDRGRNAATADERERAFFDAVAILYGDGDPATIPARNAAYRDAMLAVSQRFADDESRLFTALAILGVFPASRADHERAAQMVEAVHAHQPTHPGALHYLIHAYDTDGLYERGLPAARAYAASAPAVPHALHMPSHIFNALGYWQDSANANAAAWKASSDAVHASHEDGSERDFHALHFGQYALLQMGRYADARSQAIDAMDQYDANVARIAREHLTGDQRDELLGVEFAATVMLSSYMIESGDDALLARLPAKPVSPMAESAVHVARAFAAAAARDVPAMNVESNYARTLLAQPPSRSGLLRYVATVGAGEILAVTARANGDKTAATAALADAMSVEAATAKHWQPTMLPIPAHELAGRWAIEDARFSAAADSFRASLALYPRRPMALYGLAVALQHEHDAAGARTYAQQFLDMWSHADAGRAEVAVAKAISSAETSSRPIP